MSRAGGNMGSVGRVSIEVEADTAAAQQSLEGFKQEATTSAQQIDTEMKKSMSGVESSVGNAVGSLQRFQSSVRNAVRLVTGFSTAIALVTAASRALQQSIDNSRRSILELSRPVDFSDPERAFQDLNTRVLELQFNLQNIQQRNMAQSLYASIFRPGDAQRAVTDLQNAENERRNAFRRILAQREQDAINTAQAENEAFLNARRSLRQEADAAEFSILPRDEQFQERIRQVQRQIMESEDAYEREQKRRIVAVYRFELERIRENEAERARLEQERADEAARRERERLEETARRAAEALDRQLQGVANRFTANIENALTGDRTSVAVEQLGQKLAQVARSITSNVIRR